MFPVKMKLEARNPKFETFWSFGHLNFDIVSDFEIRISDLKTGGF